jgi:hypothetical protein
VHRPSSCRQFELPDHAREMPDLLNEPIRQHWRNRYAKPCHDNANGSRKLGEIFDVRFPGLLRLTPGISGLAQLDCDLFSSLLRLLELGPSL